METIRIQLEPRLTGRFLTEGGSHPSAKFSEATEAVGYGIGAVNRRGKYLIIDLPDGPGAGLELVVHLGMTGRLAVTAIADLDHPHLRAWWRLDDGSVFTFHDIRRFGRVRVVAAGCYDTMATLSRLGPEPFSAQFTGESLWQSVRTSRRCLKTQLLSQRPVAGVGNIYADEALWLAGINPAARRLVAASGGGPGRGDTRRAGLRAAQRRHDLAGLCHRRRRLRTQPAPPVLLRPIGRAVRALRHRVETAGHRRPRHHMVPDLPAPLAGARGLQRPEVAPTATTSVGAMELGPVHHVSINVGVDQRWRCGRDRILLYGGSGHDQALAAGLRIRRRLAAVSWRRRGPPHRGRGLGGPGRPALGLPGRPTSKPRLPSCGTGARSWTIPGPFRAGRPARPSSSIRPAT